MGFLTYLEVLLHELATSYSVTFADWKNGGLREEGGDRDGSTDVSFLTTCRLFYHLLPHESEVSGVCPTLK